MSDKTTTKLYTKKYRKCEKCDGKGIVEIRVFGRRVKETCIFCKHTGYTPVYVEDGDG